MAAQPDGIKALSILALCLGIMGVLAGFGGLVSLLIQPKLAAIQKEAGKKDAITVEFQGRMAQVQEKNRPIFRISVPLAILGSALLAAGGAAALKLRGRSLLRSALAVSILTDLCSVIVGIMVQMQTSEITRWYFKENPQFAKMPAAFSGGMQALGMAGLAFGAVWAAVKTGFYVWGILYLGKPAVRAAFEPAPINP